jgi:hypothetical protein
MKVYVLNNFKYFQNLYKSFDQFDQKINGKIINQMLNPIHQKPVLYRKANAVDRDQGQMEFFIKKESELK